MSRHFATTQTAVYALSSAEWAYPIIKNNLCTGPGGPQLQLHHQQQHITNGGGSSPHHAHFKEPLGRLRVYATNSDPSRVDWRRSGLTNGHGQNQHGPNSNLNRYVRKYAHIVMQRKQ